MDSEKLLGYLSPYMQGFLEVQAIMRALGPETGAFREAADQILKDAFIGTAGAEGIRRYEKMLGIKPDPESSLEARRGAVKVILYDLGGYTFPAVLQYLDSTLGTGNYQARVEDYSFYLDLALEVKNQMVSIEAYLRRILPASIALETDYLWNTHGTLGAYTHGKLKGKTHRELREEVLTWS